MSEADYFISIQPHDNRRFTYQPKPDITAYELALLLPLLVGKNYYSVGQVYDRLPPGAQRHLELVQDSKPKP